MKLLNKQSDYAARALLALAAAPRGGLVSSSRICGEQKIPLRFLRVILGRLLKKGWIEAREGTNGGYRLIIEPARITISEVIKAMQGPLRLSECLFRENICANRRTCPLRKRIAAIEKLVIEEFEDISIADLRDDIKKAQKR